MANIVTHATTSTAFGFRLIGLFFFSRSLRVRPGHQKVSREQNFLDCLCKTSCSSGVLTTECGRFTAYATVWSQYHLITSSRPQLLPEDTKPTTCKSDATPLCTARRSFQAQSDYGTVYLQISATFHQTASSRSC